MTKFKLIAPALGNAAVRVWLFKFPSLFDVRPIQNLALIFSNHNYVFPRSVRNRDLSQRYSHQFESSTMLGMQIYQVHTQNLLNIVVRRWLPSVHLLFSVEASGRRRRQNWVPC